MKIFLIGPGSAGKSTCGKILAEKLGYNFIDLDLEFCDRLESIGTYIKGYGYEKYCYENSRIFFDLLKENSDNSVFALSSGFLVHEGFDDLVLKHKQSLKEQGISVLLLPSASLEECTEIIIKRQLLRGFGLSAVRERIKFVPRFYNYKNMGDIKIISCEEPGLIAELMEKEILVFTKF